MINFDFLFQNLLKLFPNPNTELKYNNDFQLLLAVILSAQSTDKQVNKITSKLFQKIKTPEDILKLWQEQLQKYISSINYYKNKAKYIFETSKILVSKFDSKVPWNIDDLLSLPWVGIKTAKVVLHVLFQKPTIAVDTHVFRVSKRLWLVKSNDPIKVSEELEKIIPSKYKNIAHHTLILFGRYICKSQKPNCIQCPFKDYCQFYKKNKITD